MTMLPVEIRRNEDDIKEIQAALDRAAYKAVYGTREERSGRFFRTETDDTMGQKRDRRPVRIKGGELCPDCEIPMVRYQHSDRWQANPRFGYWRYWDRCYRCDRMQNYEAAKVEVKTI